MTAINTPPHQEWISSTLPVWYVNASAAMRTALNDEMARAQALREQLGNLLTRIHPLDAFARPLLAQALDQAFGPGLDVDNTWLFRHVHVPDAFGQPQLAPPEACLQTLLHAALQNFHEEEVANPHGGGRVEIVQIRQVNDARYGLHDQYPPHPMKIDPARFMQVCRELDLGGKYQAHLDAIVGPSSFSAGPDAASITAAVVELIGRREHTALKVQAHIALMRKDVSKTFHEHIVALPERSNPGPLECFSLRICGFAVRDIVVFTLKGAEGCVVYVPGEPDHGMQQYASLAEFGESLSRRFTQAYCKVFMQRFIAQRSRGAFLARVTERIAPAHLRFDPQDSSILPRLIHVREVAAGFDLGIELEPLADDFFQHCYAQKMLRIKDDARVLAVPTGDEDRESRQARLAGFLSIGMNVANFAAFFVPVLGEAMMVVAGAQLLTETFQGFAAWSHGDMNEALEHLGSVAQNLAFMAVFGAAIKAGSAPPVPPVTSSAFIGRMVPVRLDNGQARIWSPDLAPFAHDIVVPPNMQLSAQGLFVHQGRHYLPLDGKCYPIKLDPVLNKWRIEPPADAGFAPLLEHNGVGGWRHEGENPLLWDTRTAFKRLSPAAAALPEPLIEAVLQVAGVERLDLVQLHLNNQPPPALLADAIERFAMDERVSRFYRQINHGTDFVLADPQLQLELLTAMPRWPLRRPVRIVDAEGVQVAQYPASAGPASAALQTATARPLVITQAQIANGDFARVLIEQLRQGGWERLFGRDAAPTAAYLAERTARFAEGRQAWLFDRLYQADNVSANPLVNLICRDFPSLPTSAAEELLAQARPEWITRMTETRQLPMELAGRAVNYSRELRVSRALEGFCLVSRAESSDTLKLALALLRDVPGWPQDLRLEVREDSAAGPLLGNLGATDATRSAVLIRRGGRYQAAPSSGSESETAGDGFFSAILRALPADSRQAMGFPDPLADAEALRIHLIGSAMGNRERASAIVLQWQLKPGVRWPERLADGRVGYRLSGRGNTAWAANPAAPDRVVAILAELYPEVRNLAPYVLGRMVDNGHDAQSLLNEVLADRQAHQMLGSTLEGWVQAEPTQAQARQVIAQAISDGWRSSRPRSPLRHRAMLLDGLDLSQLADLPELPGHYRDIEHITLRNVTASDEDMTRFLQRFSGARVLEIIGGGSTRMPQGLAALTRLEDLSLEGMGLTIDQAAMDQFMSLPALRMLDLSGNRLGNLTDTGRLQLARLYLSDMSLTQWPDWTNRMGLSVLDISNNQIEHLPRFLIENEQGDAFQMTVYGSGNPFNHEELLQCWLNQRHRNIYELEYDYPASIRDLAPTPSNSDSGSESGSDHEVQAHGHPVEGSAPAPVATLETWLLPDRPQANAALRAAWNQVEQAGDAPNLLILLQRLRETRDYARVRAELAGDVLRVLEAAASDAQLRAELEIMANDRLFGPDQTCQDGVRLIFSDVQVAVYARSAMFDVPVELHTEVLFGVIRNLFRLGEAQAIADIDIASREAQGIRVDHAEVRMAYRIGLANEMNLPAQPASMVWERLAAVGREAILDARRLILQREAGPEFIDFALADRRWTEHLRRVYAQDLQRVAAPIRAEQEALLEHPPIDEAQNLRRHGQVYEQLNAAHAANDPVALAAAARELDELNANPPVDHDEFDRQGRLLIARLEAAERALLEQMTHTLRRYG